MKNQQKIICVGKELHQRLLLFKASKEFKNLSQAIEYCLNRAEEK
jgi:hypothetical protein